MFAEATVSPPEHHLVRRPAPADEYKVIVSKENIKPALLPAVLHAVLSQKDQIEALLSITGHFVVLSKRRHNLFPPSVIGNIFQTISPVIASCTFCVHSPPQYRD